ncbi:uncharacterized protein N0V89_010970 [Didymosphaeria variabile]|uniref:Uncharacterized protein n=1 Tax=Didymosphaeria variabile TaxID=1932322 RepID=A0A9W8XC84_9PLEO|nr:uncharacterized protein N0V89_010970 [Didymosphaeria variabile]KAJ4347036.1 hypothetical protein N0V89_010970 [Didymosphaeria variabile]
MPPPAPTPLSANNTYFSSRHPRKLMTLRPNTWFAVETFVEFILVSYLIWALFYFIYLWICGAVWMVKGLKNMIGRRRGGTKWSEERRSENMKDKVPDTTGEQSGSAYNEMEERNVEDDLDKKSWRDAVTYGDDTGRERRMTV